MLRPPGRSARCRVTQALVGHGWIEEGDDGWSVPVRGERGLAGVGIDVAALRRGRRPLTRRCLDLTERVPHLSGALGGAIAGRFEERGWIVRHGGSRAVTVTAAGRDALGSRLAIDLEDVATRAG